MSPFAIVFAVAGGFAGCMIHAHFFEKRPLFEEAVIITDRRTQERRVSFSPTTYNPFTQTASLQALQPFPIYVAFGPVHSIQCRDGSLEGVVLQVELEARRDEESLLQIVDRFGTQSQSELLVAEMKRMSNRARFYETSHARPASEYRQEYDRLQTSHKSELEIAFEGPIREAFLQVCRDKQREQVLEPATKLSLLGEQVAQVLKNQLSGYQIIRLQMIHNDRHNSHSEKPEVPA